MKPLESLNPTHAYPEKDGASTQGDRHLDLHGSVRRPAEVVAREGRAKCCRIVRGQWDTQTDAISLGKCPTVAVYRTISATCGSSRHRNKNSFAEKIKFFFLYRSVISRLTAIPRIACGIILRKITHLDIFCIDKNPIGYYNAGSYSCGSKLPSSVGRSPGIATVTNCAGTGFFYDLSPIVLRPNHITYRLSRRKP